MKKKTTPFTCTHCQREFETLRGIRIHCSQMHPNAGPFETVVTIPVDTKGKFTAVPDAQQRNQENVDAMRFVNLSSQPPFHYAILEDFEDACRMDVIKGTREPDEFETIEDNYRRAKRLLALRILVLKTRADLCDTLEREIMS